MTLPSPWTTADADAAFDLLRDLPPETCWMSGKPRFRGDEGRTPVAMPVLTPVVSTNPASGYFQFGPRQRAKHRGGVSPESAGETNRLSARLLSQFNPAIARSIMDELGGADVLDPCAGWGDRLVAAIAGSSARTYLGFDPNTTLAPGYARVIQRYGDKSRHRVVSAEAQNALPGIDRSFDLVFTSPPYFDTEHYSDEPTQSFARFPTYDAWCAGFYFPVIEHSIRLLRPGGHFALNIADVFRRGTHLKLTGEAITLVESILGLPLTYHWAMYLSGPLATSPLCEHVLVWKK